MAILRSSPITFVDLSDQQKLNLYITSNLTHMQVKDSDSGEYNPDWSTVNLVLTPNISLDRTIVSPTDDSIKIQWTRRFGHGEEVALGVNEVVKNGELTVNQNQMVDGTADALTYICRVTHTSPVSGEDIVVFSQLTFNLMRTASNAKTCSIIGAQAFKYDQNGDIDGEDTIILTAIVQNVTIGMWQYYDAERGEYINIGTSPTLSIAHNDAMWGGNDTLTIKLTTGDSDVSDILTLLKLYDGADGQPGKPGTDAYTIILSNEAHTFPGGVEYAVPNATAETYINAYLGTEQQNITVKKVGVPDGIGYAINGNSTNQPVITFTITSNDFVETNGVIPIEIQIGDLETSKDFSWSVTRIGDSARTLSITAPSNVFKYDKDGNLVGDAQIELTAVAQNVEISEWQFFDTGSNQYVSYGVYGNSLTVAHEASEFNGNGSLRIRVMSTDEDIYDFITLTKLYDGVDGQPGSPGDDAYTLLLTNESHTFPGTVNCAALNATAVTNIVAYRGSKPQEIDVVSVDNTYDGIQYTVDGSNPESPSITFRIAKDNFQVSNGVIPINLSVGDMRFTKEFSWSVAYVGKQGVGTSALSLNASSQVFKSVNGEPFMPELITLTPTAQNLTTTSYDWSYSIDGGRTFTSINTTNNELSVPRDFTGFDHSTSVVFKCAAGDLYDTITISQVSDGKDAEDAYTILLTNENHTFLGDGQYALSSQTLTQIYAYRGTEEREITVLLIDGSLDMSAGEHGCQSYSGMSYRIDNNGTINPVIYFSIDSDTFNTQRGNIGIDFQVDGMMFRKNFIWTLVHSGINACSVSITPSSQVFKSTDGVNYMPDTITLTPTVQNLDLTNCKWYYNNTALTSTTINNTAPYINNTTKVLTIPSSWNALSNNSTVALQCKNGDYSDIVSVSKITDGQSAYVMVLDNEAHIFPGSTTYIKKANSRIDIGVMVYHGIEQIGGVRVSSVGSSYSPSVEWQSCGTNYNEFEYFVDHNESYNPIVGFRVASDTITTSHGSIPINVTLNDGTVLQKYFSWSVAYTGAGACSLSIAASSQVFKSSDGTSFSPEQITLTPIVQNLTLSKREWFCSNDGGETWTKITATSGNVPYISGNDIIVPSTSANSSLVFKCSISEGNNTYYDTTTISWLSDGQSATAAYTPVLSNELQSIPVDSNDKASEDISYSCQVQVYEGTTLLSPVLPTAAIGEGKFRVKPSTNLPTGIASVKQDKAGVIVFSVNKGASVAPAGSIDLDIEVESDSNVIKKSISFVIAKAGADGAPAVTFDVHPVNGTVFRGDITSLPLTTFALDGSTEIADNAAQWQWYKYSGGWQSIATGRSYTVTNDDVTNITSYKCEMTYNGVTYSDIVTLTDQTDIYTSELRVVGGTTFHNGQHGTGVYALVFENGIEIDPCPHSAFPGTSFPADAKNGEQYYIVSHEDRCIYQRSYNGTAEGTATTINQTLKYTWTLMDKFGNHVTTFNKTGKVIYLSAEEIDSIGTIQCDVTK